MEKDLKQPESNSLMIIIVIGFISVTYMLYSLTLSIYRNYNINLHIKNFEKTNLELQQEIENKMKNFSYFTSVQYQDKIAKQNLGQINPGEEVIVIPPSAVISTLEFEEDENEKLRRLEKMPNLKRWWEFLFSENPLKY